MSRACIIAATLAVALSRALTAQDTPKAKKAGPRRLLPRAEEIALARSAAPAEVSARATIWALTAEGYEVAAKGTNGVNCYVSRDWVESIEPQCFDAEGSATILPMALRRVELRSRSVDEAEIDRRIAAGLASGEFRAPQRPAMSYMMSSAQVLYDDDGTPAGAWHPHLMIYYPYLKPGDMGLGDVPSTKAAMVFDAGKPTSCVVIIVPTAVDPDPATGTGAP